MRLKSIKLAGFKSFVDPTTVTFTSNMSAVVGPNGCGKSNIIDAVKWVMGESSAKNLRGESMTDVIFNGSTARKPVGQASIELIFDNSARTLKGEFAGFNEISVKRKVTRDSDNTYYMNGTKCRRKDITDLFLGTGLGPRSYAIIEQGMISKLIEAKPQELRVFIEEAAGISRYKERRRDTENRIRRSRENLERLTDIREELERQLAHLNRQAKTAQRYKELKQQERDTTVLLWSVQWQNLMAKKQQSDLGVGELQVQLESILTEKSRLSYAIEKQRLNYSEQNERFTEVQAQFYNFSATISRIEQQIAHIGEREQQLKADLEQSLNALNDMNAHSTADSQSEQEAELALEMMTPQALELEMRLEELQAHIDTVREQQETVESRWDLLSEQVSQAKTEAELEQNRCQYAEKNLVRLQDQQQHTREELERLQETGFDEHYLIATEQLAEQQARGLEVQESIDQQTSALTATQAQAKALGTEISELNSQLQQRQGKLTALKTIIDNHNALGTDAEAWLVDQQLQSAERWLHQMTVEASWQQAVEAAMLGMLEAVNVSDLHQVDASNIPSGIRLFEDTDSSANAPQGSLASKITAGSVPEFLNHVMCVDSLTTAIATRKDLANHQCWVTADGFLVGSHWLRAPLGAANDESQLEIVAQIHQLDIDIAQLQQQLVDKKAELAQLEQQQQALQDELKMLQRSLSEINQSINTVSSDLARLSAQMEQTQQRLEEQQLAIEDIDSQIIEERELLSEGRIRLEQCLEQLALNNEERDALQGQREDFRSRRYETEQHIDDVKQSLNQLHTQEQLLKTQLASARTARQRASEQSATLKARVDHLQEQLNNHSNNQPELEAELELALEHRLESEQQMAEVSDQQSHIESEIKQFEQAQAAIDTKETELRTVIEDQKLAAQTVTVQLGNVSQQLMQGGHDPEQVLNEADAMPSEEDLSQSLATLANSISRLGAINLAAIDEYEQQSERKRYLDQQNDDLVGALETLEDAIRKIDKETRSRFKATYDEVNNGLQNLFPQVFGGGQAYLELTDDDLLETGIAIMARPPGKRNSTIHLLSGGEKALTAIALVFAIFKLNPAPFCMLDEVDAPLDDANVGRYARMVKSMSENVQFIYITHNKIPMEHADQLMGVTMQEAGVSRLVSVDINKAAELAAL